MHIRPAAVAGSWYPATRAALAHEVDDYAAAVAAPPPGDIRAIIAPHAGIMFSGPVAAHAYVAVAAQAYDVAVLVGPSHFSAFEGMAVHPEGAFETPLGLVIVDGEGVRALASASPLVDLNPAPHRREHALEMQLPFLRRLLPDLPIVAVLMGRQRRATVLALGAALGSAFARRNALLIASTDLSHYFDAATAATLDQRFADRVSAFDPEGVLDLLDEYPENERGRYVGCGAGPAVAVMLAARRLGARAGRVLKYSHSGEVSGDNSGVVGYLAAAFGTWPA